MGLNLLSSSIAGIAHTMLLSVSEFQESFDGLFSNRILGWLCGCNSRKIDLEIVFKA